MPIGTGIVYNTGDLILSQVSSSGTAFLETKIAAATSSLIYFDSTARINSASLNSITVGTASYVSGSNSIITNITASNISASGTSSFGYVGIGTTSPTSKLDVTGGNIELDPNQFITFNNAGTVPKIGYRTSGTQAGLDLFDNSGLVTISIGNQGVGIGDYAGGNSLPNKGLAVSGNVGIGTSTPSYKLHISGSAQTILGIDSATTTNVVQFQAKANGDGVLISGIFGTASVGNNYGVAAASQAYVGTTTLNTGYPSSLVIGNVSSIPIAFSTNNTERMRIDGSGNVGIGTTSPGARLDVRPTTATAYQGTVPYQTTTAAILSPVMAAASVDTYTSILQLVSVRQALVAGRYAHGYLGFSTVDNSNISGLLDAGRISIKNDDGIGLYSSTSMGFWTNTGGSASNPATERVRIASDGNVGIGTTSPNSKLEVAGTAGTAVVSVTNSGTGRSGSFGIDNNGVFIRNSSNGDYFDLENATGTSRFRVLYDTNTYINTTFTSVGSLTASGSKLSVFGNLSVGSTYGAITASSDGAIFEGNVGIGTTSTTSGLQIQKEGTNTTSGSFLFLNSTNASFGGGAIGVGYQYAAPVGNNYTPFRIRAGETNAIFTINSAGTIYAGDSTGAIAYGNHDPYFAFNQDTNTGMDLAAADTLTFKTGGSEKVRIDSSGNVGIGTTVSTGSLHVYKAAGTSETTVVTIQEGAGGAAELVFRAGNASTNRRAALRFFSNQVSTTTPQWLIGASTTQTNGDDNFYFNNASNTSILTLSQTNVGIGTTVPVAKLQVAGNVSGSSFTSSISNAVGFLGTSSWAQNVVSASYALSSSFATTAQTANALNTGNSYTIAGLTNNGTLSQNGNLSMGSGNQILATTGTEPIPGISFVGDTNTGIYAPLADTLGFSISGSERVRITTVGNVGVGTSNPAYKLDVSGSVFVSGVGSKFSGPTSEDGFRLKFYDNGGITNDTGIGLDGAGLGSEILWFNALNGFYWYVGTGGEKMRLTSAGNLGIGTSSPAQKLEVQSGSVLIRGDGTALFGTYYASAGENTFFTLHSGSGNTFHIGNDVAGTNYNTMVFTAATDSTGGKVGIGTTSPVNKLQVAGNISGSSFTSSISNAVGFLGTSSWAQNVVSASYATTAQTANALNPVNSYTITNLTASNISASLTGSFGIVGIGTNSPTQKLHVVGAVFGTTNGQFGNAVITGTGAGFAVFGSNAGATGVKINLDSDITRNDLVISASTGYVGIGTNSPVDKLTIISGSTRIASTALAGALYFGSDASNIYLQRDNNYDLSLVQNGDSNSALYLASAGNVYVNIDSNNNDTDKAFIVQNNALKAGTELFRIQENGNVGIGTTSPAAKLHVYNGSSHFEATSNGNAAIVAGLYALQIGPLHDRDSTAGRYYGGIAFNHLLNFGGGTTYNGAPQAWIGTRLQDTTGSERDYLVFATKPGTGVSGTGNDIPIERMCIDRDGNIGIGTTVPTDKLTVYGELASYKTGADTIQTQVYLANTGNTRAFNLQLNSGGTGLDLWSYNSSNAWLRHTTFNYDGNVGIGTAAPAAKLEISGSSNSALLNIKSPISGAILYVSGSGAVGINTTTVGAFTLQVNGSFGATTKSFIIDHPTKEGKKLMYGSLESPYHGIRLTGRDTLVNGKCKIQLPDYMYKLILHDSVNIQLTGIKCNKTLYVDDINIPENYFTIAYDKAMFESYKDYDFFWDFTAIRADVPELTTEL